MQEILRLLQVNLNGKKVRVTKLYGLLADRLKRSSFQRLASDEKRIRRNLRLVAEGVLSDWDTGRKAVFLPTPVRLVMSEERERWVLKGRR